MKTLFAAVLALALAAPASAQEGSWDARITAATGDVVVRPADGSPEVSAEEDMPLEEGDRIVVGEDGSAELSLDGGSLITVRAGSEFKLEKTAKGDSTFMLTVGSLLAKIQKLGPSKLRIKTPTAVAAVRGTEFGVEVAANGDDTYVGVFDEGKVDVSGADGSKVETLISNQETSVLKGAAPAHAVQLQRFVARRAQMRGHGRRLAAIKGRWKALPPDRRREMRQRALERMRDRRLKNLERLKAKKEKMDEKERRRVEQQQRRRQEDRKKMEQRRQNIRNRRQGQ